MIGRRLVSGWAVGAAVLCMSVMRPTAAADDLRGVVRDEAGRPIAGAIVSIAIAGPKVGTAALCPSCYADCVKQATTDARGAYVIKDLDPKLKFGVFAVAMNHPPEFVKWVDPSAGTLDFTVKSRPADLPDSRLLKVRVVDERGEPVEGAMLALNSPLIDKSARDRRSELTYEHMGISSPDGVITIVRSEGILGISGELTARGFAARRLYIGDWTGSSIPKHFPSLLPSPAADADGIPVAALSRGAALRGKVERDGRPVAGVSVQLVDRDRSAIQFMGWHDIATDEHGHYLFSNVPAGREWDVYVRMGTVGFSSRERVGKTEEGAIVDVPALQLEEGVRVSGRVVLSDGQPIPPGIQLGLGRKDTWDAVRMELPPDGRFSFEQIVRGETVSLSLRLPGYRPVSTEPGREAEERMWAGLADDQCTELELHLEPGELMAGGRRSVEEYDRMAAREQLPLSRLARQTSESSATPR